MSEPSQIIYHGDCLDVLRTLADNSVDSVVTDPPYAITSEASSQISRTRRSVREYQFYESWLREHLAELVRVTKPTGAIWMTVDWRGAMALDVACARLNIHEPKVGVWDKESIGMGGILRNSYECFAVVPMNEWKRQTASEPDVWRCRWTQGGRESDHRAEKPVELMRRACRLITSPGGTVLDPFAGSGSTGKACALEGFGFIGIEREAEYVEIARARIAAARRSVGADQQPSDDTDIAQRIPAPKSDLFSD